MRLVNADDFISRLDHVPLVQEAIKKAMDCMPTIEERKMGEWIGTEFDGYADGNPVFYEWQCSECGCIFEDEEPTYNFCPNCGARMKGESDGGSMSV